MKKNEVEIGKVYLARVTNKLTEVRIDVENRHGGWDATNVSTGKKVRIKSAQRLRAAAAVSAAADGATTGEKKTKGTRKAKAKTEATTTPTSTPTVEDGANGQPAAGACPNCGSTERDADGDCANCREPKAAKQDGKPKRMRAKAEPGEKRMSGIDAAAKVLEENGQPMTVREMVEQAAAKGYWQSPGGKTPAATLYSAIIREIAVKGTTARFTKTERGKFAHRPAR